MKKSFCIAILGILVLSPVACASQEEASKPVPASVETVEQAMTAQEEAAQRLEGEVITFGVYSGVLKVGSGRLAYIGRARRDGGTQTPEAGGACQAVDFTLMSFSVKDHEKIIGTGDFASPVRVVRDIRVFGSDEDIVEEYDPAARRVTITKRVDGGAPEETLITSERPLGNVLLLIYRLRCDPELAVGAAYDIVLPTSSFRLMVKEKKALKVPLGRFDAFYIESEPKKYRIWLSAGPRRIPLRIQGLAAGGMAYLAAVSITSPVSE